MQGGSCLPGQEDEIREVPASGWGCPGKSLSFVFRPATNRPFKGCSPSPVETKTKCYTETPSTIVFGHENRKQDISSLANSFLSCRLESMGGRGIWTALVKSSATECEVRTFPLGWAGLVVAEAVFWWQNAENLPLWFPGRKESSICCCDNVMATGILEWVLQGNRLQAVLGLYLRGTWVGLTRETWGNRS